MHPLVKTPRRRGGVNPSRFTRLGDLEVMQSGSMQFADSFRQSSVVLQLFETTRPDARPGALVVIPPCHTIVTSFRSVERSATRITPLHKAPHDLLAVDGRSASGIPELSHIVREHFDSLPFGGAERRGLLGQEAIVFLLFLPLTFQRFFPTLLRACAPLSRFSGSAN